MHTSAPARTSHHARIRLSTTAATEFVDLTDRLDELVSNVGVSVGTLNIQTLHTTTAIIVNEHEPQLLTDFAACLERMVPADMPYILLGNNFLSRFNMRREGDTMRLDKKP